MPESRAGRAPAIATTTVTVPGGTLACRTAGTGPAVVFVHAAIADSRMWERELVRFGKGHRTVAYDLRGFGTSPPASGPFSYVDDLRTLLERLGVPDAFLVGCSMGGAFAINFALEHPGKVRGLLLAAPGLSGGILPPFSADEQAALDEDDRRSQPVGRAWSQGDRTAAVEHLRELWCSALTGPALALFRRMVEENLAEVFDDRSAKMATPAAAGEPRLPELRVPTTVLVGDRDNPSSPVFASRVARGIPGARLETIAGADHLINLSQPAAFDRILDDALGRGA